MTHTVSARRIWVLHLILSFVVAAIRLPGNDGEDIVNARLDFRSKHPGDFWGGTSAVIYGKFPTLIGSWQTTLVLTQIVIANLGLVMLTLAFLKKKLSILKILAFATLSYLILILASQTTRDGLQLSLALFGIGLLFLNTKRKNKILKTIGVSILVLAISLRPWLSPIFVLLVASFCIQKENQKLSRKFLVTFVAIVLLLPTIIDLSISKIAQLNHSYPEQQVMIMDLSAAFCYGTNSNSAQVAERALAGNFIGDTYPSQLCQFFRPDSWVSLQQSGLPSTEYLKSNFRLIGSSESNKYLNLRQGWMNLILHDPITWFQNKMIMGTKVIVGGDNRILHLLNAQNALEVLRGVFYLPWDLARSMHLFSVGACFVLILLGRRRTEMTHQSRRLFKLAFLSNFALLVITTISYSGSNARYTYTGVALTYLSMFFGWENSKKSSLRDGY